MRPFTAFGLAACMAAAGGGCVSPAVRPVEPAARPSLVAVRTAGPIQVDGVLDEPVWQQAPVYVLDLAVDRADREPVQEAGRVRLAWDDAFLYLGVAFADTDVAAEGFEDQKPHWQLGDVCELFLKPADAAYYWELYVTPKGHKTSYWFPGPGRLGLPSCFAYTCGLTVAARADGTVNDWRDEDQGWTAELAMPAADLTAEGASFGPGSSWRVLVSRYNYSRSLKGRGPELTMTPKLSVTNFHTVDEYGELRFEALPVERPAPAVNE
ncbi:MAG: carbohydrate-binding family 9-like protein [Phycisphaerae bacterium]|nr:carbohydrate-binding family 9-like protein [Phycisphaerae bacterium]